QSPPFVNVDLYTVDQPLREAVAANGGGELAGELSGFGRHWGRAEMFDDARLANEIPPVLKGDMVEFHPAYHRFMGESMKAGLHNLTWRADGTRAAAPGEVARAA